MPMYDLATEILAFHDREVKLDDQARANLASVRDTNLNRVRDGLRDQSKPVFKSWRNQGGYAMDTVVNDPTGESDHDIDVALIFHKDDLPAGALAARQRVRDALLKRAGQFLEEPEARTNAVTVWYADGYHLDFAVYRRSTNGTGQPVHEHASTDWVGRDPDEVSLWFNDAIAHKSPIDELNAGAPKVRKYQLRRIVRLVKWFCRSRSSWNLPGGMIVSALVVECYRSDRDRDDVSLYLTLSALKDRLAGNCRVYHPKGDGRELTGKITNLNQVKALKDRLTELLPKLSRLFEASCTRQEARSAWDWIFNNPFWAGKDILAEDAALASVDTGISGYAVTIECELSNRNGKTVGPYRGQLLPKNMGLRFFVSSTNVPAPYSVRFEVKNTGEEANQARQLEWSGNASSYSPEWTTSTAYKGTHRMTCNIVKEGLTLATASIIVKIGRGLWLGRHHR